MIKLTHLLFAASDGEGSGRPGDDPARSEDSGPSLSRSESGPESPQGGSGDGNKDDGSGGKDAGDGGKGSKRFRFGLIYLLVLIFAVVLLVELLSPKSNEASFAEFVAHVEAGNVVWVNLGDETYTGVINVVTPLPPGAVAPPSDVDDGNNGDAGTADPGSATSGSTDSGATESTAPRALRRGKFDPPFGKRLPATGRFRFSVKAPRNGLIQDKLVERLRAKGVQHDISPQSGQWSTILLFTVPFILLLVFWFFMMRQSGQLGRTAMTFGKARAKLAEEKRDVTFDNVAGCEEAKEELSEIVDFLRSPKKYHSLGGRMPKGILLVGPPGTGKTLLARAVAGEAGKPFFSLSGSDFVEMFVGVGAARVRDLFQQAKVKAPCIVFVDELDAVGRHRGAGLGGGHDEREQTLNQLLVEMDGFDVTRGVIFLAATNRPDVLDPALLRPGRFDRQIVIDAPDAKGRKAVLEVHSHDKPFADDVDFEKIAARTPGFTGADLANAVNEAALLAARAGQEKIGQAQLEEAIERVIAGPERRSRRISDEERKRVAIHEAGHALVAALSKHADPVRKISIVPRGHAALGYTMQTPEEDRYLTTKDHLLDQLKTLMAGRAAELLVFNELSTGAGNDLQRATAIARSMICRFGMSEALGPVVFGRENQQVFLGRDINHEDRDYSDETAQAIDQEVRKILDEANSESVRILGEHRESLDEIAEILLEKEVMQGDELTELLRRALGEEFRDPVNGIGAESDEDSPESTPASR